MSIIQKTNDFTAQLDEHLVYVKEFKTLIDNDPTEDKEQAKRYFMYIYNMHDTDSPYIDIEEDARREQIRREILEPADLEITDEVKAAEEKFLDLFETKKERLLKSAYKATDELRKYFDQLDLTKVDDKGKPIHKAKDLISSLSKLSDVVDGLDSLIESVQKDKKDKQRRGNITVNQFSK